MRANLLRAYAETEYHVLADPPVVLRIGKYNEGLAELHRAHGVMCSAFVTAFNPYSEPLGDADNAMHEAQLMAQLHARGLPYIEGVGQHPSGNWPGEDSVLVLGIGRDAAAKLGAEYRQNAIVWCGADAVPELVLLV